ncbi:hypothetical protein HDK77DRAFT_150970 [Phyllosticta capitalensis]
MAATPPLHDGISTPPAPGPQFDDWEPYRRSRRVAQQQRGKNLQEHHDNRSASPQKSSRRQARASTPVGRRTSPHSSTTAQTISPPSSPRSPVKRTAASAFQSRLVRSFDYDPSDPFNTSSKVESSSSSTASTIPQTPAKTPGKRKVSQAAFGSTARVLFHDRPASIDDAMPPRTARKKKRAGFEMGSFAESLECDKSSKIEIYTDGKERVPSVNDDEDNPFITKPGETRSKPVASSSKPKSKRDEIMERRARNNEGVIHVHRGRKMFSEFVERPGDSDVDESEKPLGGSPVRHLAAAKTGPRRLTRSSIKPRLLWPNEEQQRARASKSAEEDFDEFDMTTNSGNHCQVPQQGVAAQTPAKQRFFNIGTPPSTRPTRASTKKDAIADAGPSPQHSPSHARQDDQGLDVPLDVPKKRSPFFNNWRRTKSGSGATNPKREGELLEAAGAKRTRSATQAKASSSMH